MNNLEKEEKESNWGLLPREQNQRNRLSRSIPEKTPKQHIDRSTLLLRERLYWVSQYVYWVSSKNNKVNLWACIELMLILRCCQGG